MLVALNAWFWDQPETGSGQYLHHLVEELPAIAPDLRLALIRPGGEILGNTPPLAESPSRARSSRNRFSKALGKTWFEQVGFPRVCARQQAAVAHVPYWAPPLVPAVSTVVTIHDLIPLLLREYRGGPALRSYTALVSTAAESATLVLTDSKASRRDILAHLDVPPERVRPIPLAADHRFSPHADPEDEEIRRRYALPERYFLYLGGFDVRKNVGAALRAMTWVGPLLGMDCPLVLAGRLPTRDRQFAPDPRRQAEELGLEPGWVQFTDTVLEREKPALYRGAVAFLFPSRYEGFGLPPLEALACGVPVVGSHAASIPEVVGEAGVLVEPDDAAGMAGALIQLAEEAAFRDRLSERALAQAQCFSWERTARETFAAYQEAAA